MADDRSRRIMVWRANIEECRNDIDGAVMAVQAVKGSIGLLRWHLRDARWWVVLKHSPRFHCWFAHTARGARAIQSVTGSCRPSNSTTAGGRCHCMEVYPFVRWKVAPLHGGHSGTQDVDWVRKLRPGIGAGAARCRHRTASRDPSKRRRREGGLKGGRERSYGRCGGVCWLWGGEVWTWSSGSDEVRSKKPPKCS